MAHLLYAIFSQDTPECVSAEVADLDSLLNEKINNGCKYFFVVFAKR
jgi:hypothetical protein